MPAKDIYHQAAKNALIKYGWTITHDPLRINIGERRVLIDLGAERVFAAEKAGQQIAVEIKSFIGASPVDDLEDALGQFVLYHDLLQRSEPNRVLYLAVRREVYDNLFQEPIGQVLLENKRLRLLIFAPQNEEIVTWID